MVPLGPTAVQYSSPLWRLDRLHVQKGHAPLTFQQVYFISLRGWSFGGGKITSACSMSSDLFHNKSHVVFACGSIEYLLETVATSEHSVMVNLMESVM